jgi:hypothetical protein
MAEEAGAAVAGGAAAARDRDTGTLFAFRTPGERATGSLGVSGRSGLTGSAGAGSTSRAIGSYEGGSCTVTAWCLAATVQAIAWSEAEERSAKASTSIS